MQRSGCLTSRRLREVPGVGPVIATAKPAFFDCARSFSAWLGITPRLHSNGGKERTFGITKRGNTYLRRQLIIGARAVVRVARGRKGGMIEQIRIGKTRTKRGATQPGNQIWARPADHHTGQQLLKRLHPKA